MKRIAAIVFVLLAGCVGAEGDVGEGAPDDDTVIDNADDGVDVSTRLGRPYHFLVNHYSGHWPSRYTIEVPFPSAGVGVHFYARWKWYQGYGSRTVCLVSSTCGWGVGRCSDDFDLPYGGCTYEFDVDGPYQMQAKVGWFEEDTFTDWWTR